MIIILIIIMDYCYTYIYIYNTHPHIANIYTYIRTWLQTFYGSGLKRELLRKCLWSK